MIVFLYAVSVISAFFLGFFLPKEKTPIKTRRQGEELLSLKEIENFLTYDGSEQE